MHILNVPQSGLLKDTRMKQIGRQVSFGVWGAHVFTQSGGQETILLLHCYNLSILQQFITKMDFVPQIVQIHVPPQTPKFVYIPIYFILVSLTARVKCKDIASVLYMNQTNYTLVATMDQSGHIQIPDEIKKSQPNRYYSFLTNKFCKNFY